MISIIARQSLVVDITPKSRSKFKLPYKSSCQRYIHQEVVILQTSLQEHLCNFRLLTVFFHLQLQNTTNQWCVTTVNFPTLCMIPTHKTKHAPNILFRMHLREFCSHKQSFEGIPKKWIYIKCRTYIACYFSALFSCADIFSPIVSFITETQKTWITQNVTIPIHQ